MPEEWQPSSDLLERGQELGLDINVLLRQTEAFRDYWLSKPGANAMKLDWDRTWMNWMRKIAPLARPIPAPNTKPPLQFRKETKELSDEEWRRATGRPPRDKGFHNPYCKPNSRA